jgi:hypothetical protein
MKLPKITLSGQHRFEVFSFLKMELNRLLHSKIYYEKLEGIILADFLSKNPLLASSELSISVKLKFTPATAAVWYNLTQPKGITKLQNIEIYKALLAQVTSF